MIGTTLTRAMRPPESLAIRTPVEMAICEISISARSMGTTIERNMEPPDNGSAAVDRHAATIASGRLGLPGRKASGEVRLEERNGPTPGEIGRLPVVPRGVGVVVEGMVGALVDEQLIALAVLLQRRFERRDARIDALIDPTIVEHQRRVDCRDLLGLR